MLCYKRINHSGIDMEAYGPDKLFDFSSLLLVLDFFVSLVCSQIIFVKITFEMRSKIFHAWLSIFFIRPRSVN